MSSTERFLVCVTFMTDNFQFNCARSIFFILYHILSSLCSCFVVCVHNGNVTTMGADPRGIEQMYYQTF